MKRVHITWADSIAPEPVTWAWSGSLEPLYEGSEDSDGIGPESSESSGRIAAGTIAIAAGPEGVGKSSFGITIAALVSTGRLHGAWFGTPRTVLYAAVEDSWAHTLVPRLMAAGADLARIGRFEVVSDEDLAATLSLPHDNDLFEAAISDHDVALVVLDPLMSLVSDRIDTHREREVREALDPLAKIADRTKAVILGIAHWNKGSGSDISARITGSGAFKNVPRAIFGFGRDPESLDGGCVMTQSKNSLGRSDLPSIRYRIESATVGTPHGDAHTGRLVVLGVSDRSLAEILATANSGEKGKGRAEKLTPAQEFILTYVQAYGDAHGEVASRDLLTQGAIEGFKENDLSKARNAMRNLVGTRKTGTDGGWNWFLTDEGVNAQSGNAAAA
ncbi:AAA family ATPase [Mycolicibacterium sphagni]|uniref:AAA family ATPase n=1 Tax=Mycolicibacterium sphagni TaxID=1786 RepID=UPI0013FE32A7|nr:AAA family ATPase [Mycolicibacterium sphagni]